MACRNAGHAAFEGFQSAFRLTLLSSSLALGACAQFGSPDGALTLVASEQNTQETGTLSPGESDHSVEHWAKEYASKPRDLDTALAYAKSLKAADQKSKALAVLQDASMLFGADKKLASEYGRLALELDQVSLAKRLLEIADDPAEPDWRVILARGTVLAKEGKYREAIDFFSRALVLVPDHPSAMNNLALAYTMSGEPAKAEEILRRASSAQGSSAMVRQNLALVLSLQGKYEEAAKVGSEDGGAAAAQANAELVRKMVKLDPKPMVDDSALSAAWETQVSEPVPAKPSLKSTTREAKSVSSGIAIPKVAAAPGDPLLKPSTR